MAIDPIADGDAAAAVRTKLNAMVAAANNLNDLIGFIALISATPTDISASTYTLQASDLGRLLRFTGACVVTLPNSLPAGWWCVLRRAGSGAVSWTPASGATRYEVPLPGTSHAVAFQKASVTAIVDINGSGTAAEWIIEGPIV